MAQEPRRYGDGEMSLDSIGPEGVNRPQQDESAQTQTVADEVLGRAQGGPALSDSVKVSGGIDDFDTPDIVDHMNQMVTSGRIDMSAFRGERSDDDVEDLFGQQGVEDDDSHPGS
jgi:hypothetical protein